MSQKFVICRIYTGIHAKSKLKFKSGAISESTTALNVDQSNTSVHSIDQKNTTAGGALPLPSPSPLAPTTVTRGNNQEQPVAAVPVSDIGNNSGSAATTPSAAAVQKKEGGGLTKVQADRKKIDARKKSLKRL